MGANDSMDEFNRHADTAINGVPQEYYIKQVDDNDMLILGDFKEQAYQRLEVVLDTLAKAGIIVSGIKIAEGKKIEYCGFVAEVDEARNTVNILPDPEKVS